MEQLDLRDRNKLFMEKVKKENPGFFDELKKGQTPEYFLISCSDSRVSPSVITQTSLGEMFVHRNIANQVSLEDESLSASLYYALKHLKVKKIVVKGHTDCGGVKAAWNENDEEELRGWIKGVRDSLPEKTTKTEDISVDELTKYNVLSQVEKLKQHPVYLKYGAGVEISGCLFHVDTGELEKITQ